MKSKVCNGDLAERNVRLIYKLCYHYWGALPLYTRSFLDVQEVVDDTVLAVVKASYKYNDIKGAESTFVHRVASNHLQNLLAKHHHPKRMNAAVELREDNGYISSIPEWYGLWFEAKHMFEHLLESASNYLRTVLERFFSDRKFYLIPDDALRELKVLVRMYGITRDEFAAVLRVV